MKRIFIYGSDQQLDCIFLNLISNSYKSFEAGKITNRNIDITISMESPDKVKIIYTDNGEGLSKEIKNKNDIFEPYKSYGKKNQGTGMGMWILSSIVEKLSGNKILISEIGNSGFIIELILLGGRNDGKE